MPPISGGSNPSSRDCQARLCLSAQLIAIIHKVRILTVGGLFSGLDEGPAHSHLASRL